MNIWGPICWLVDPITEDQHRDAQTAHARRLGFTDADALSDAQHAGNRAADGDEMAALAMRYIDRDRARVAQSRRASKGSRKGKWDHLRDEAMGIGAEIRAARADLSVSAIADLVQVRLSDDHNKLPDKRTVERWLKKV
ncbi:hypothetical protein [Primorskyibacter sp. S87]|uniref:hypothetical protein n=1 Tax=Primorskyibacter sp. S87 TaxID=3415126 RepID=UPI003C7B0C4E